MACIFDNAIFDPRIFDVCPVVTPTGDGGELKVTRAKENLGRHKRKERERLRRDLEEMYAELVEGKPRQAKAIVAPFVEIPVAKREVPQPYQVDFTALSQSLSEAKKLIALYEEMLNEEEEAFMMLLAT